MVQVLTFSREGNETVAFREAGHCVREREDTAHITSPNRKSA